MSINLPIISKFDNSGTKQAEGAFGGLGKSLLGLGGIIGAAFSVTAITNFAKEAVLAAEGVATANARIDNISKSMGIFGDESGAVADRLKAFAEGNELALGTDAELIKSTQAKLLTFKELAGTADEAGGAFDRATLAAVDLAAAGFGQAETNAIQLGKALNDPIKGISALTRSGVTFTEAEKEKIKTLVESGNTLEAQNLILSAIETQVGGTAEATATASDKIKLAFDNLKETAGAALLPAFEGFTAALLPLVEHFLPILEDFITNKIAPGLEILVEKFTAFTTGLMDGTVTFETVTQDIGNFIKNGIEKAAEFLSGDGLTNLVSSFMEIRSAVFEGILEALPGILEGLVAMIPQLVEFVTGTLIPQMLDSFALIVTELATIFSEIMPMFIQAIADIVPELIRSLVNLLPPIIKTLLAMVPELIQTGIELFNSLVEAVVEITPQLVTTIVDLLPELIDSIISMLPGILDAAIELFTAIIEALPIILPVLINAVLDLLPEIIDALIGMIPALIDASFKLWTGLIIAIQNVAPGLILELLKLIPRIVETLLGAIPKMVSAGFELVNGFARGIIDNFPKVVGNALNNMGKFVIDVVRGLLGIKSPSRVFMGIGEDVVAGLNAGLKDGEGLVAKASMSMAHTVTAAATDEFAAYSPSIQPAMSSRPSSGGQINITVNAGMGADGTSIGQQIVNEILRYERSSGQVFARS